MANRKLILLIIAPIFPTPPIHQMMHPMSETLTASLKSVSIGHRFRTRRFAATSVDFTLI
jgi:hypothetical protein